MFCIIFSSSSYLSELSLLSLLVIQVYSSDCKGENGNVLPKLSFSNDSFRFERVLGVSQEYHSLS